MSPEPSTNSAPGLFSAEIPQGFIAVPISTTELAGRMQICVLLGEVAVKPQLIVLRDTMDGRAFLGCLTDSSGVPHRWLELWVQNFGNAGSMPAVVLETLSNSVLDLRWNRAVQALERANPQAIVRTGWETSAPLPVWIDPVARLPVHPQDAESGEYWALCRDESILAGAGLPSYGSSLHRYLYLPKLGSQSSFVAVTANTPLTSQTKPLDSLTKALPHCVLLNSGGLMCFRTFEPMSLEALFEVLSGKSDATISSETLPPGLRVRPDSLQAPTQKDGWIFLGQQGRWGRLLEAFHLKLRALAGAFAAVRSAVEHTRRPMLNLSADSFRVSMGEPAPGLPRLWTCRIVLADGGDAVEVPVPASDASYYIPRPRSGSATYRPGRSRELSRGVGTVRIRKTFPEMSDGVVVEATLATQERVDAATSDLLWVRLNFDEGPLDLYARIESETGLAAGEWRFRSLGQRLDPVVTARLQTNEGRPTRASFEVLPVLSSPCDLYSLAVLAVRALLVNSGASLPVALDEALSLARQVAVEHDPESPLPLRIRSVMESNPRWMKSMGPQRLIWEDSSPESAMDLIPLELWLDMLSMIVAMFPGVGPDSACADLGAAPHGALQRVFDRATQDVEKLLVRTRSLIVIDWRSNREIHSVIRGLGAGLEARPVERPPAFSGVRVK